MNRQLKKREWLFAIIYLFRFSLKVKIYFKRGEDNLPMLTNLTVGGGLKFLLQDANGRKSLANGKNISCRRILFEVKSETVGIFWDFSKHTFPRIRLEDYFNITNCLSIQILYRRILYKQLRKGIWTAKLVDMQKVVTKNEKINLIYRFLVSI